MRAWFVPFCALVFASYVDAVVPACAADLKATNTYTELRECLELTPPNAASKAAAVESLQKMLPSYVFTDISRDSPDPNIPIHVDLYQALNEVASTEYATDADLQQAFADVFVPLHDAHTRYNKPSPYRESWFAQPFVLNSIGMGDEQHLIVLENTPLFQEYEAVYGEPVAPQSVDGWTVLTIDGQPAMQHLIDFATNKIGYVKDVGSRFNLAVNGFGDGLGYWAYRPTQAFAIPQQGTVRYELQPPQGGDSVVVDVAWLGVYHAPANRVEPRGKTELEDIRAGGQKYALHTTPGDDVTYEFIGAGVGVLSIRTFGPKNQTLFVAAVQDAMAQHMGSQATRLIIDLRGNGGGDICLGFATARFLFPQMSQPGKPYIGGRYDMMRSELFAHFAEQGAKLVKEQPSSQPQCLVDPEVVGYFTPCAWLAASDSRSFTNASWMLDGPQLTRGGVVGNYSTLIHESCDYQFDRWVTPGTFAGLDPANTMLLSDGLCGSTCSCFSSYIQLHSLAKTVVVGGLPPAQQQFWAFPGGEVETIEMMQQWAEKYHSEDYPALPKVLPDGATFRFAIREIYPPNVPTSDIGPTSVPLEFAWFPSNFHVPYFSNYTDNSMVYTSVLPFFDYCVPGIGAACTGAHGHGVKACVDGQAQDTCMLLACDPGYGLTAGQCEACAVGEFSLGGDGAGCQPCSNAEAMATAVRYTSTAQASANCAMAGDGVFDVAWQAALVIAAVAVVSAAVCGVVVFVLMKKRVAGLVRDAAMRDPLVG